MIEGDPGLTRRHKKFCVMKPDDVKTIEKVVQSESNTSHNIPYRRWAGKANDILNLDGKLKIIHCFSNVTWGFLQGYPAILMTSCFGK